MRKLATGAFSFSAAMFAAHYIIPVRYIVILAGVLLLLSPLAFAFKGGKRQRALLILLPAAAGVFIYGANARHYAAQLSAFGADTMEISTVAVAYPTYTEGYSYVDIRLENRELPKLKARLYSFREKLPELNPGDEITAQVRIKASDVRSGESYYGHLAEGTQLLCYLQSEQISVTACGLSPIYWPKAAARAINQAATQIFDGKTAPFMTALLTGDTELLSKEEGQYSDLAESGILHVVSVSGMHVAFLVGFMRLLLRRKKTAALVCIPLVWIFVPIAGATPSIIRAAFMQSSVLAAPLLKRENDGLTSLSAVLAVMLLINPFACASISLQLSFGAMLGMIIITPRVYFRLTAKKTALGTETSAVGTVISGGIGKLRRACLACLAASVGAIVFSTPVSVLHFGYVPLYSIIVNMLIFWAVSLCFLGGYISCLLWLLWQPLGAAVAWLPDLMSRYILWVAQGFAGLPYAAIYTGKNIFGLWLVSCYLIFAVFWFLKRKTGFRPVLPVCLSVILLCGAVIYTEAGGGGSGVRFTAADVGQGQCLIISGQQETLVIDCGGGGKNANAGDIAAGILLGQGRRTVDMLALTHFDTDHCNGAVRLMNRVKVRGLAVPPYDEDDTQADKIIRAAEKLGVEVYIIQQDYLLETPSLRVEIFAPIGKTQPCLMYLISAGEYDAFVSGDADFEQELRFTLTHSVPDCELYVAGHHGSKNSGSAPLLESLRAESAIISCGLGNRYGHPERITLERLAQANMRCFRTDLQGSITIAME